jgi:hypothetical protein
MANEPDLTFDKLVSIRERLQRFCALHYSSLAAFHDGISFKFDLDDASLGAEARHLSSSATCIESLLECPEVLRPKAAMNLLELASNFGVSALKRPQADWASEKSAHIYCRCRTLPLIVRHLPKYDDVIREHIEKILAQLMSDPNRLAIGEASPDEKNPKNWYPPNAFHTYWTLYLLHSVEKKLKAEFDELRKKFKSTRFDIDRLRAEMLMWARQTAGYQVALHSCRSPTLDSDQLAWSVAILAKFGRDIQANLLRQDFLRFALSCLFDHQNPSGIWRRGTALFHYPISGNAYCYVFETFAVLLKSALTPHPEGAFLREVLYPYAARLLKLGNYAVLTQLPLQGADGVGWISGHRVFQKKPESWATASVFSFCECLRRLIGIWTREEAFSELRVSPLQEDEDSALEKLWERGETWARPGTTAAIELMTLFVNPVYSYPATNGLEPDDELLADNQARGAILFGPPGTSKTTLCQAVADAIGWQYVEIHASDFVAAGLPQVQAKADTIFKQLMQLDHTVILFDEIDELVRAREMEPDAFGRFLTTSMLPKLAQLWTRKKVIYFVATNHIQFFDPAVTRAHRFDALIQVAPPSFDTKVNRIKDLLKDSSITIADVTLTQGEMEKTSTAASKIEEEKDSTKLKELPPELVLAKFLLLRFDQLPELAAAIRKHSAGKTNLTLSPALMKEALCEIADPFLNVCKPYRDFVDSKKYEQHDFSMLNLWELTGTIPDRIKPKVTVRGGRNWYNSDSAFGDLGDLGGKYTVVHPGAIEFQ